METVFVNDDKVDRKWLIIDAKDLVLGRLSSQVATYLKGKHKPSYSPSVDVGDNVIVINAELITVSGQKELQKKYWVASSRPGKSKFLLYKDVKEKNPTWIIENAVKGMLPKNILGRAMIKKLHVYAGESHPHTAQKPETVSL